MSHAAPLPTTETPCMLCRHCRTFAHETDGGPKYVKVRCARGHWKTPTGRDRVHHICAVRELVEPGCPDFDTMVADDQDPSESIRTMLATLPETRVVCGGGW